MSSQEERTAEQKQESKNMRVVYALEHGISEPLRQEGDELKGLSITINPGVCRMVIRALVDNVHSVGFVYSDTASNCLLKAAAAAQNRRLTWDVDNYYHK